jgi:N utilization substance protein B
MGRRRAREAAMQALFQLDLNPPPEGARDEWKRALDAAWADGAPEKPDKRTGDADYAYAWELLSGTCESLASIDETLAKLSKEWKVPRMTGIDRSVLRLAVYELQNGSDVTPGIVINEAVELAKKFGTDDSGRFVNGVLGTMMREEQ